MIKCRNRRIQEMDNLEAVWLQLKLQGKKVLFGTFYIPPNSNQDIGLKLENTFDMALNDNSVYYIMATRGGSRLFKKKFYFRFL
jgi:hypothetical protein